MAGNVVVEVTVNVGEVAGNVVAEVAGNVVVEVAGNVVVEVNGPAVVMSPCISGWEAARLRGMEWKVGE